VYVRYPHHDLLNILALEAERAGAFVVGEDLGTVEDHVRDDLAERAIMSSRVWWFEDKPPAEWPTAALGSVSTHDLPTVAGVVTGSDLEAQRRIGIAPDEAMSAGLHRRIEERTGADGALPVTDVIARVHADLAQAPCLVLTASLEDVLGLDERPNMPGTIDQWPNWRLALPVPTEELSSVPLAKEIATILSRS
jgi:4-alpha-glucanotransferase